MIKRFFELFIGFRYLKAKKSQGFISFNTFLSVFIVFIGVFILVLVIGVMNGFQSQIKDKIIDVDSHITVSRDFNPDAANGFRDYSAICDRIRSVDGVVAVNPYYQGHGLVKAGTDMSPIMVRGFGNTSAMPDQLSKFIVRGEKKFSKPGEIYIGIEMANNFSLEIGQTLQLIVPRGKLGSENLEPGVGRFKIAGFFKTGYYEFDTKLVIVSLPDAQKLFASGDAATAISVSIKDIYKTDRSAEKIRSLVGFSFSTQTAEERNQNLFYALKLEKLIMTIILFLIVVSAGFTIMGTLVMVVMDKRRSIGILKSMGATPYSIMTIFVLEGFLIGLVGALSGIVAGLAASLNLELIITKVENVINSFMGFIYHFFNLGVYCNISLVPSNVYYIEGIPTQISPEFITFIATFAVFLSTLSAIFPAWYASRLNPIETIRYE